MSVDATDSRPARRELTSIDRLQSLITSSGIRNFSAAEICRLNRARVIPPEAAISCPPVDLWPNMIPTLRLAEAIRAAWHRDIGNRGGDVTRCGLSVISGYRPDWYNRRVKGAPRSQHVRFSALDLSPINGEFGRFLRVASATIEAMGDGKRVVGFGRYDTFIHVDTGRVAFTNWDNRSEAARAEHARFTDPRTGAVAATQSSADNQGDEGSDA